MDNHNERIIVFWGTGQLGQRAWDALLNSNVDLAVRNRIYYCDNNSLLWGSVFFGRPVISPYHIKDYDVERIVITCKFVNEIRKQLIDKLDISEYKIWSMDLFFKNMYTQSVYKKQYGKHWQENKNTVFNTNKIVVYTAILGDYDELKTPEYLDKDITYVCFTNDKSLKSDIWHMEYISNQNVSNQLLARKIKLTPYEYFSEYETSVWVDGRGRVKKDLRGFIQKYGKKQPILCYPHAMRECIYDEQAACIIQKKGRKEDIVWQITNYRMEGFPFNQGLYETGCIVRNHNDEFCKKIMNEWLVEVENYSQRDQLSLPYVCWKNNFKPDICDICIWQNEWLEITRHKKESGGDVNDIVFCGC